jgi:hypothetical protein
MRFRRVAHATFGTGTIVRGQPRNAPTGVHDAYLPVAAVSSLAMSHEDWRVDQSARRASALRRCAIEAAFEILSWMKARRPLRKEVNGATRRHLRAQSQFAFHAREQFNTQLRMRTLHEPSAALSLLAGDTAIRKVRMTKAENSWC